MIEKEPKAKQPSRKRSKPVAVAEVIKNTKTTKTQNNSFMHCPRCNRAYKVKAKLDAHIENCDGTHKGGRVAGKVSPEKQELAERKKQMQHRIAENVDKLLNAQMKLAVGETMLFVRIKERDEKGKVIRTFTERITKESTIKEYLDDPDILNDDDNYYYITTQPANNQAIANLLDRAFGRPKESVELSDDPEAPVGLAGTGTTTVLRAAFLDLLKEQTKSPTKAK